MELLTEHAKELSDRILSICSEENVEETQCEDLVKSWLRDIELMNRPTVSAVMMRAKQKRYNLV